MVRSHHAGRVVSTSYADPLTVLSYNLWHGRAQAELPDLVRAWNPDLVCIQEARASLLLPRLHGLRLAGTTSGNRLGIAVYVRESRFEVEEAGPFRLSRSRHDRLVGGTDHRMLGARIRDRLTGQGLVAASFHGTPFTDSNAFRRLQVDDAHRALQELGPGLPILMAGDYNHPILLPMLRRHLRRRGFATLSTASSTFHREGSIMRGRFDLATMSGFDPVEAQVIAQGSSDHLPVLFTVGFGAG